MADTETKMKRPHRRIFRTRLTKPRACTLLAAYLRHAAVEATDPEHAFVKRDTLETIIAKSSYASTVHKTIGYVDDIRTYHGGDLSFMKEGRLITAVRLNNPDKFTENGFAVRDVPAPSTEVVDESVDVTETVTEPVPATVDSDLVVEDNDEPGVVVETAAVVEPEPEPTVTPSFGERMKALRDAKKRKAEEDAANQQKAA